MEKSKSMEDAVTIVVKHRHHFTFRRPQVNSTRELGEVGSARERVCKPSGNVVLQLVARISAGETNKTLENQPLCKTTKKQSKFPGQPSPRLRQAPIAGVLSLTVDCVRCLNAGGKEMSC